MKELSHQQLMRYSRQIMLPICDIDGQEKLFNAKILLIGVGGLGCAVAQYLVASGVGHITLVDDDKVDIHNLQRQVLHFEHNVNVSKVCSAKQTLLQINSDVKITTIEKYLLNKPLFDEIKQHDVVVDCCDNLATRNNLNRGCFMHKKPLVSGAAIRMEGQVSTYTYQPNDPCYQCLSSTFKEQILSCSEAGILSPVVGVIGTIQATEVLKVITGIGDLLSARLLLFDAASMQFQELKLQKQPNCELCNNT